MERGRYGSMNMGWLKWSGKTDSMGVDESNMTDILPYLARYAEK